MKNDKGFYDFQQPMSKTQPAKASPPPYSGKGEGKTKAGEFGNEHEFNIKGKVTSNEGSTYHDVSNSDSGLTGNFKEKDASQEYLRERGMKGQEVRHFNATKMEARMHTGNSGGTVYNSNPVYETYHPATSNKQPSSDAVIRPRMVKPEAPTNPNQEDITDRLA